MLDDFAVFIITYARPNAQLTLDSLRKSGYTGKIFLVLDTTDSTIDQYKRLYSRDTVLVFDKTKYAQETDTGLSSPLLNYAVFARNAVEDFAHTLNLRYFAVMDDDITGFRVRYISKDSLRSRSIKTFDFILQELIGYMDNTDIACLGLCNASTLIGGLNAVDFNRGRILVQAFIRNIHYNVNWRLNMLEDVITSVDCGVRGQVWLKLYLLQFDALPIGGVQSGGNSEIYLTYDWFKQTFFPVLVYPACFIYTDKMFKNCKRGSAPVIKHDRAVPKIISSAYKKG